MLNHFKIINAAELKVMAMLFMLCDHLWGSGVLGWEWLTVIGRLAFPIFAFQIAEGFAHTHDRKAYMLRMLLFALITELPFNYMMGGGPLFPLHQNVLFTFLLSLLLLCGIDRSWRRHPAAGRRLLALVGFTCLGYLLGFVTFVDYYGFGVVLVILFWVTRDKPWGWAAQLVVMWYINWVLMGGQTYPVTLLGHELFIPQQGFALLSLIPIWMYNGKRGPGGRGFQYFTYAFYPAHILVLVILSALLRG